VVIGELVSPSSKIFLAKEEGGRKYQLPNNRQQGNEVMKQQIGGRGGC
jgi:hypothetical protein